MRDQLSPKNLLRLTIPLTMAELCVDAVWAEPKNRDPKLEDLRDRTKVSAGEAWASVLGKNTYNPKAFTRKWKKAFMEIQPLSRQVLELPNGFMAYLTAIQVLLEDAHDRASGELQGKYGRVLDHMMELREMAADLDDPLEELGVELGEAVQRVMEGEPVKLTLLKKFV